MRTITVYVVRVRDTYCGLRGEFVEEQDVLQLAEARQWARQFRAEYPRESGYRVTITLELRRGQS